MCGIAGFLRNDALDVGAPRLLERMAQTLTHRGPDDAGTWSDRQTGIGLAHRRLSIIDRSTLGSQPMTSSCGRYVLCYNGEIYNFTELRVELAGRQFRGRSDTEVLLEAIGRWGLSESLGKVRGMFSFALWDRQARVLSLARDRMGEKPLYYGWFGSDFAFASELAALTLAPGFTRTIDKAALSLLLRHNYIPAPYTIWEGVSKLLPGTTLTIAKGSGHPAPRPYWDLKDSLERGQNSATDDPVEFVAELERLLAGAVKSQLVADVPVGVYLSGGVDSSVIASVARSVSARPVRTFTVGFRSRGYDEAPHAAAVARHLGTEHTEIYVDAGHAARIVPELPAIFDEPFADASQIPATILAREARQSIQVSLSGDGGDELFAGYGRYHSTSDRWALLSLIPGAGRRLLSRALHAADLRAFTPFSDLRKLGGLVGAVDFDSFYVRSLSQWHDSGSLVAGLAQDVPTLDTLRLPVNVQDPIRRMMYLDAAHYLPDDILCKVDRSSMSVGLEVRAPFLDQAVVEHSFRAGPTLLRRGGAGKWALRHILDRHVPSALTHRAKMGFSPPIAEWLRGALREWAEDLLSQDSLLRSGVLIAKPIREIWGEHARGRRDHSARLWTILMFQAWHSRVSSRTAAVNVCPRA